MLPFIPGDSVGDALELACYVFTAAAALLSCLFTCRF